MAESKTAKAALHYVCLEAWREQQAGGRNPGVPSITCIRQPPKACSHREAWQGRQRETRCRPIHLPRPLTTSTNADDERTFPFASPAKLDRGGNQPTTCSRNPGIAHLSRLSCRFMEGRWMGSRVSQLNTWFGATRHAKRRCDGKGIR